MSFITLKKLPFRKIKVQGVTKYLCELGLTRLIALDESLVNNGPMSWIDFFSGSKSEFQYSLNLPALMYIQSTGITDEYTIHAAENKVLMCCRQYSETPNSRGEISSIEYDTKVDSSEQTIFKLYEQLASNIGGLNYLDGVITVDTVTLPLPDYYIHTVQGYIVDKYGSRIEESTKLVYGEEQVLSPFDSFVATSEYEMLHLKIKKGDRCYRSDLQISFINTSGKNRTVSDWSVLGGGGNGGGDIPVETIQQMINTSTQPLVTHKDSTINPHSVTKVQVGLGNVPNVDCTNASNIITGILPNNVIPHVAITDTYVVASEAAQLLLTIQRGDVVVRTDVSKCFINVTGNNTNISDWQEMLVPTDNVLSVNGQTGAVVLNSSHIAEGSNLYYTEARVSSNVDVIACKAEKHTHANKTILDGTTESFTVQLRDNILANNAKVGITSEQAAAIVANTAKVGITTTQVDDIVAANTHRAATNNPHSVTKAQIGLGNVPNTDFTADVTANTANRHSHSNKEILDATTASFTTELQNLINIGGFGLTVEQVQTLDNAGAHLVITSGNPHNVTKADVGLNNVPNVDFTNDVDLNTINRHTHLNKTILDGTTESFTTELRDNILANNAKVGITSEQAAAIVINSEKVGITSEQAAAIIANTAKVGITPEQIVDIVSANTHRNTVTGNPHNVTKADVGLSNVPNVDFTSAVAANTAKVGITPEQANDILISVTHAQSISGNPHQVSKNDIGLSNVPNTDFTSDVAASNTHRLTTVGNPHNVTKADIGLALVPNVDFTTVITENTTHTAITAGNPHNVTKDEIGLGNVPNVDCTNASNITTGTLPSSVLPALSVIDTFAVDNEVGQLALTVQQGDIVVRTDINRSYINLAGNNNSMDDWQELMTPTDSVLSVNNQTGTVILTSSHIAEGSRLYYTEERVRANSDVAANTASRHTHTNRTILENTTAAFTTEQAAAILINSDKVGISPEQTDDIISANQHRAIVTGNPHQVTKAEVGLGNVPNHDFTAEVNANTAKVGITPEQTADIVAANAHRDTVAGNPHAVTKSDVGLGNVPNVDFTSAVNANTTHANTVTGNPHNVTKADVGLSNVPNVDFTSAVAANTAKVGITPEQANTVADALTHIQKTTGNPHQVNKNDVGLGNVQNVDYSGNILVAMNHVDTITGNPHGVTKADVGLSNVPNVDCTNASNITTGTLPSNVLPPLSVVDTFVVNSEFEQLALTVQKGDIAVRTDISKSFINISGNNTALVDWQELMTPTDTILSVNGQTGTVVLSTSHIAEGTNLYYTEARVQANADVAANTFARHVHGNKAVLDATTESFTAHHVNDINDAVAHSEILSGNPHQVTKNDVGLSNVPNVDFTNDVLVAKTHAALISGNPHHVTKADVGLSNVPNVDFTSAVAANTAKVGITPEQAAAIVVNTAKVGITVDQVNAINASTLHKNIINGNPHHVTKADVGLSNVPNVDFTSAVAANTAKVGITSQQAVDIIAANTHRSIVSGNPHNVTKADVGLSNVPNVDFTDALFEVSTHSNITAGNPHHVTKADVGLSNVPNVDCTNASNITTGTLPNSVLPPLSVIETFVVASEVEQLALTVQKGDIAVRTDVLKSFINFSGNNTSIADWQELLTPTDTILSVNGQTGVVVLNTSNIDEGSRLYYTEERVALHPDVIGLKAVQHTHGNKATLDGSTAAFTTEQAAAIVINTAKVGISVQQVNDIIAANTHRAITSGNPHQVTKAEVGLGNVPNTNFTTDVNAANTHRSATNNPHGVTKSQVGLGNVPNVDFTSEINANITHRNIVIGNPHCVTKAEVGLGNVPNTDFSSRIAALEMSDNLSEAEVNQMIMSYVMTQLKSYDKHIADVRWLSIDHELVKPIYSRIFPKFTTYWCNLQAFHTLLPFETLTATLTTNEPNITISQAETPLTFRVDIGDVDLQGGVSREVEFVINLSDGVSGSLDMQQVHKVTITVDPIVMSTIGLGNEDKFYGVTFDKKAGIICVGDSTSIGSGNSDAIILRYTNNFNYYKGATLGNTNYDYFKDVICLENGNLVCVGFTNSAGVYGSYDGLIVKFDQDLNILSRGVCGDTCNEYLYGVAEDSFGNIICVGYTNCTGDANRFMNLVIKFDSNMNILHCKYFGISNKYDYLVDVAVLSDDTIICVGNSNSIENNYAASITKLDSNLNVLSSKMIGTSGKDEYRCVYTDENDLIYCVGYAGNNGLLTVFNSSLTIVQNKFITQGSSCKLNGITKSSTGEIICVGECDISGIDYGFIIVFNTNFTVKRAVTYGGNGSDDRLLSVAIDGYDNVIAIGYGTSDGQGKNDGLCLKWNNLSGLPSGLYNGNILRNLRYAEASPTISNSNTTTSTFNTSTSTISFNYKVITMTLIEVKLTTTIDSIEI